MVLLQRSGFGIEELFQALVFFVIFLLPVARGVIESRRKRAAAEAARREGSSATEESDEPARAGGAPDDPAEGRQLWEQLLRGELAETGGEAPESPPEPTVERERPPPRPKRLEPRAEPAPTFGGLEDIALENELETTGPRSVSTERGPVSPEPLGSRLPSRQRATAIAPPGPELASVTSRIVELPDVDLTAASFNPYGSAGAVSRDVETGRSIRALRQAVVWTEILGPPVSLRGPGKGPAGPPGLGS